MLSNNVHEREIALGKREALKQKLKKTMLRAGIYVDEIHGITNRILGEDFLSMDITRAKVMMDDLVILQRSAIADSNKIDEINEVYHFEDEPD